MRKCIWILAGFFLIAGILNGAPRLPVPEADQGMLPGIDADAEAFVLEEIDTRILVLIVYDLYCPACQKSASNMKRLAESLEAEAGSKALVLGVGSGDTPFEARAFRKKFRLPFPCVSDREKGVAGLYSVNRTPSVMVLTRSDASQPFAEIYRHESYLGREHIEQVLTTVETVK